MTEQTEPNLQPLEPTPEATPESLSPGFHVMHEGTSLGIYPTAADAEAFADAHPRHNGLTVEILEVK